MATEQLLLRLPEELVRKFRRVVPERQRSAFVRNLLEQALAANFDDDSDPLYLAALAVEQDSRLTAEMAEWKEAVVADGLDGALAP
jgi:metal-responsive CopG/Arc/MetJ family transcriptional regulator